MVLILLSGLGFYVLTQVNNDTEQQKIELSALRLLEDLRECQQRAIAENSWLRLKVYPEANSYKIFNQGGLISSTKLQKGVRFGNRPPELIFQPTGTPSVGMTIVIQTPNNERRVIIAPVLGRTRIEIIK